MNTITCKECGKDKPPSEFYWKKSGRIYQHKCKDCVNTRNSEIRRGRFAANPHKREEHNAKTRDRLSSRRRDDPEWRSERNKLRRDRINRLKAEVMVIYGGICECCGESNLEFLCIDHVNGGGNKHRDEIGKGNLYQWLKKMGYPEGFRVLCHNCNFSMGAYGYCPHQLEGK